MTVHFVDAGVDTGPGDPAARGRAAACARRRRGARARCARSSTRCCPRRCGCSRAARSRRPGRPAPHAGRAVESAAAMAPERRSDERCSSAAPGEVRVRRALLSVSDKPGIVDFARGLEELGRRDRLHRRHRRASSPSAGIAGPRDRGLHGLSRDDGRARQDAAPAPVRRPAGACATTTSTCAPRAEQNRAGRPGVREPVPVRADGRARRRRPSEVIENIDIGGPTMIRAAAKNSAFAAVVVDPETTRPCSPSCATAGGRAVAGHARVGSPPRRSRSPPATTRRSRAGSRERATDFPPPRARLREGHRPALRREPASAGRLLRARRRADAPARRRRASCTARSCRSTTCSTSTPARELVEEFDGPACAIVKHNNPCGVRVGADRAEAYERAFACDPQ